MMEILIAIIWLSSGFAGSAIITHVVGTVHPWLGLKASSPFPLLMSAFGPFNLLVAGVYAAVFWREYRATRTGGKP